eukprot:1123434-Rhodomonas_salina.1
MSVSLPDRTVLQRSLETALEPRKELTSYTCARPMQTLPRQLNRKQSKRKRKEKKKTVSDSGRRKCSIYSAHQTWGASVLISIHKKRTRRCSISPRAP